MFSKSFGYALRGVLYVALFRDEKRVVQVDEIATALAVPRHFMGKIMKHLVKHGILNSAKGPQGGFFVNEQTLSTSIINIISITDGSSYFTNCVLRLHECSSQNPCPLHQKVSKTRDELKELMSATVIGDLLNTDKTDFVNSIRNFQDLQP